MGNHHNWDKNHGAAHGSHGSQDNWRNAGEEIKEALSHALETGNFKNLNHLVTQTVSGAVSEAGKQVTANMHRPQTAGRGKYEDSTWREVRTAPPVWQQRAAEREQRQQLMLQQQALRRNLPAAKFKKVGGISNVLYQTFGGIGLGITGMVTLGRTLEFLLEGDTTPGGWLVNLLFLAGFFGMVRLGIFQRRRLHRAERYLQLCDNRMYEEIAGLAGATMKSPEYVVRDLRKMLNLGFFPEGHLDTKNTCLMLSDTMYRQYQEAEHDRQIREAESRRLLEQNASAQTPAAQPTPEVSKEQESELNTMVSEGISYISKLRDLNDKIPGEVISAKLFCLENLLKDIFDSVRERPEQMHRMHKLMDYYLPTTLKLVEAYEEFDRVSSPGNEILKAKAEIENTLETINQAFRELLNSIFQATVFDVTTDAQVLKTMLAREGLTRDIDFATAPQDA